MRAEGLQRHPEPRIRWVADALPELSNLLGAGLSFAVILASAVWQHLHPSHRPRAFRKLVSLLKPGGLLAVTLRHGPAEAARGMHLVSLEEIEALARDYGLAVIRRVTAVDSVERSEVSTNSKEDQWQVARPRAHLMVTSPAPRRCLISPTTRHDKSSGLADLLLGSVPSFASHKSRLDLFGDPAVHIL
jgi:SAM-dependent methyltransferase